MGDVLLSGTAVGSGDVAGTTAAIYNLLGSLDGSGGVSSVPVLQHRFAGHLDGAGGVSSPLVNAQIFGGQVTGRGGLADLLLQLGGGEIRGAGDLTGTLHRVLALRPLPMVGGGGLHDAIPLPFIGAGSLTGLLTVCRVQPRCPQKPPKTFKYGQIWQTGDLTLQVKEGGLPLGPVVVLFSLYQLKGESRFLVGPPDRRPASAGVGSFYATGTAGENGQPGCWLIQWRWQKDWNTPVQFCEQRFQVQDALLAGVQDGVPRCKKYGWD